MNSSDHTNGRDSEAAPEGITPDDEMLPEYDFSNGERGRYAQRYAAKTNLVALSPDVAAVFPDSQSVNDALRALMQSSQRSINSESHNEREAT